ncbi:helix-turn-helix transcriptional regulator [Mammaliicoccus sciuri]
MKEVDLKSILREKRSVFGYSQQQVAEASDISRQFYGMIENGERRPSVEVAKKIGKLLNINWSIFFETKSNHELRGRKEVG